MLRISTSPLRSQLLALLGAFALLACAYFAQPRASAQDAAGPSGTPAATPAPAPEPSEAPAATAEAKPDTSLNLLRLYFAGGFFMYPITLLSILSLVMAIERGIGLRRSKVMPEGLIHALGQLGTSPGGFDPRKAFRICQQFPSAASTVLRTMLLKIGRPISEIEHSVKESSDREATRLYSNVRWINLAASVSPLLGLLGTVQGMIIAFHRMTDLAPGADKAVVLSAGIYVALITTFAGLVVAIPSVIISHWYEGKIQSMFHEVDELVFNLLPQAERYENRVRFTRQHGEDDISEPETPAPVTPVAAK